MKTMKVELSDTMAKHITNIAKLIDVESKELLGMLVCNTLSSDADQAENVLYGLLIETGVNERAENSAFEVESTLRAMREKMSVREITDLVDDFINDDPCHDAREKMQAFLTEGEKLMMRVG